MIWKTAILGLLVAGAVACSDSAGPEYGSAESGVQAPEQTAEASGETSGPVSTSGITAAETRVTGTIKGTRVEMLDAELDDQLAIFEEDGWGFSPSLLIFMFLDEGESPEGRTFSVSPEDKMSFDVTIPHVHYRWRAGGENDIESDVVSMEYSMELTFGQIENGELPGEITFSVPGEDTSVSGTFRAKVEQ